MNDQLIDKMADAIVISMVKQGAAAPASWASAFNYVRQHNPFTPEMVQKTKDWALKGGKIGTGVGAGIGAVAGMVRGARQTAQQAGGWRNASFGQYAKNMAGQGAMGGVVGAGVGAVGGAGAGALGVAAPYAGQVAKQTIGVHKNDLKGKAIADKFRNFGQQVNTQADNIKRQIDVQKARRNTNTQAYTDADRNQNIFGRLTNLGQNARIKEKTKASAEDAYRQISQLNSKAYNDARNLYYNGPIESLKNELGDFVGTIRRGSNNIAYQTSLPAQYFDDAANYAEDSIRNLGNLVSY